MCYTGLENILKQYTQSFLFTHNSQTKLYIQSKNEQIKNALDDRSGYKRLVFVRFAHSYLTKSSWCEIISCNAISACNYFVHLLHHSQYFEWNNSRVTGIIFSTYDALYWYITMYKFLFILNLNKTWLFPQGSYIPQKLKLLIQVSDKSVIIKFFTLRDGIIVTEKIPM